jgi:hypothetical protein
MAEEDVLFSFPDRYSGSSPLMSIQGASPRELILEACRRNNTSLLEETIEDLKAKASKLKRKPEEYVAETLNKASDGVGNGCLHLAAAYGSCKCTTASQYGFWASGRMR